MDNIKRKSSIVQTGFILTKDREEEEDKKSDVQTKGQSRQDPRAQHTIKIPQINNSHLFCILRRVIIWNVMIAMNAMRHDMNAMNASMFIRQYELKYTHLSL